jgi:hypothetical protein
MTWKSIVAALVKCELAARYDYLGGWSISAKGIIAVLAVFLLVGLAIQ